ncbi:probable methyltransferase PMT27 [Neltuma alba]|uniref:probable methyltransferase PMT27 n=1 Tax=Neltuma alba TaxID=207710 RepID=UPI0010A2C322|nr:probable methyltransferase PMT27 [Prosopis alba]
MALSKSRNNRRSSLLSYAPTLIVLVVIAICVLAVWRINLNPVDQPQKRTTVIRKAIDASETQNDISSFMDSAEITSGSHDQKINRGYEDNPDHLSNGAVKFDDGILNSDVNKDPHDDQSFTSEAQLLEGDTLTQNEGASETNEADADNDRQRADAKMSGFEEVQGSSIAGEASDGNQNDAEANAGVQDENSDMKENKDTEYQNVNTEENQEVNAEQQPDVRNFDNRDENSDTKQNKNAEDQNENANENQEQNSGQRQGLNHFNNQESKNDEDEQNEKQLREDKGEIAEEDEKQQDQKQDNSSNASLDSDIHSTSTDSQLESHAALEDESSQLTKTEFEQETQKPKLGKQKRTSGNKKAKQSKEIKSLSEVYNKSWSTQADQSQNEKERRKDESKSTESESLQEYEWRLCNVTASADYIPCLDNEKALKQLRSTIHYEHRERHCPEDAPTCLVPLPKGYKTPIEWPSSRDKIWYYNVPHTLLAEVKGHQNWVKVTGEFLTFPGGGTQFIHGALHYIDFIQEAEASVAWGKQTRVVLDVGCGVGSFGGYLFERDVLAMSFAPKDEHVAQVQFAIERGIPAISAVMGSQRLPFPSMVFDLVHCARCRVPWHADGGLLLLELNRLLRPGGYFVWSATPVYQKLQEDVQIWNEMSSLTKSMCWELVTISKDKLNSIGAAIYRKPTSNECYEQRQQNIPPICSDNDDPNASWYVPLQACLHKVPATKDERGARWPEAWPNRLRKVPYWLNDLQMGIYGKLPSQDFVADTERWKNVVDELSNIGITWSNVRNIMDMRAVYGGFAAALRDLPVWVLNVVNIDSPDTLPIIYERGLFGMYHDWCESFSTYPRTYDLLHADGLFSKLKNRCNLVPVMAEVDRIARPGGKLVIRDDSDTFGEVESLLRSLHWEITSSKSQEGLLCAKKGMWRPKSVS